MAFIKKILLAVDFSETTTATVSRALFFAKKFDAELVILHSIEPILKYPYLALSNDKKLVDVIAPKLENIVSLVAQSGVPINQSFIQDGIPETDIILLANSLEVDLIVIGAGRKNIAHRLLGSVAEKIIHRASQPVCIVHPDDAVDKLSLVVCALDCSSFSEAALNLAVMLSRSIGLELFVIHVFPPIKDHKLMDKINQSAAFTNKNVIDNLKALARSDIVSESEKNLFLYHLNQLEAIGMTYHAMVRVGKPVEELIKSVDDIQADILILGAHNDDNSEGFFQRGTFEKMLRRVNCSVMTVRLEPSP